MHIISYMHIFIIIIVIFIILLSILIYYKNNRSIEYFSCPSSRVGYICNQDNNKFGICDFNNDCISLANYNLNNKLVTTMGIPMTSSGLPISEENLNMEEEEAAITQPDTCIKNQNFDSICKKYGPNYGIESVTTNNCLDGYSEVKCSDKYINGNKYDNLETITPCLAKNIDFDDMCRYYNKNTIPNGYNINSIGAKKVLVGSKGDCFMENGQADNNSARAICTYDNNSSVPKLNRAFNNLDYNKFTSCEPIESNFNTLCPSNNTAIEIMGYDCMPGYARAKCINDNDLSNYLYNNLTNNDGYFNDINTINVSSCNC